MLLLAGAISLAILAWAIAGAIRRSGDPLLGDGFNAESYGFDLSNCLVERDRIIAAGMRKDQLPSLVDPPTLPGADIAPLNARVRGKYLVSGDRVIGVSIGGVSRAYPLVILNCHEIVNDTLGGVPIAVTYNPLCDSAVVFDRHVAGETVEFGVSGLLYNSNLLMYDRREDAGQESLWSQLQCRAIAGPAALAQWRLVVLPSSLVTWKQWLTAHPDTTVLDRDPRMLRRYQETSYESYFASDRPRFPFSPPLPDDGPPAMTRVIVVETDQDRGAWTLPDVARHADADGTWQTELGDVPLTFSYNAEPPTADVSGNTGDRISVINTFWFAWHAMHPGETLRNVTKR